MAAVRRTKWRALSQAFFSMTVPAMRGTATKAMIKATPTRNWVMLEEVMFSEDEQSCIREAIGDDAYAMLLESNPLDPAAQGTTTIFGECLSQETSVTLFLAGFQVVAGGAISDASMTCVGNAVAPHHAVLSAAELDPAVEFGFLPCLTPEEMAALQALAPQ